MRKRKMIYLLPELAEEWGVTRQTVLYYVNKGLLKARRDGKGSRFPYRVTWQEKERFERDVQPNLTPGRNPTKRDHESD